MRIFLQPDSLQQNPSPKGASNDTICRNFKDCVCNRRTLGNLHTGRDTSRASSRIDLTQAL